jgi:hypothetical protein
VFLSKFQKKKPLRRRKFNAFLRSNIATLLPV